MILNLDNNQCCTVDVKCNSKLLRTTIYVADCPFTCLMGRLDAIALVVLRVGLNANSDDTNSNYELVRAISDSKIKPLGKLANIQLKFPFA